MLLPHCPSAPQMGEVRDKPIVSYVGDTALITCKMEDTKPPPTTWIWYKANGTEKVGCSCQHIILSSDLLWTNWCLAFSTLKGNNSNLNFPFNFKRLVSVLLSQNIAHENRNHTETIQVHMIEPAQQGGKCTSSLLCTCRSKGVHTWRLTFVLQEQILAATESQRHEIKSQERKTQLVVHNLTEADSGSYFCSAVYAISSTLGHVELKVRATQLYMFCCKDVQKIYHHF